MRNTDYHFLALLLFTCVFSACTQKDEGFSMTPPSDESESLPEGGLMPCNEPVPTGSWTDHLSVSGIEFETQTYGHDTTGGLAVGDFTGDGNDDLLLYQIFDEIMLYEGQGDGTFVEADVTIPSWWEGVYGASTADYDADGYLDVLLTGPLTLRLWRNLDGAGFEDVTEVVGLAPEGNFPVGAAWADYDADGDLDLYVSCHVDLSDLEDEHRDDAEEGPPGLGCGNALWQNTNGVFEQVSSEISETAGVTHHSVFVDYDVDGDLDLLTLNDGGHFIENSEFWENQGIGDDGEVLWRERLAEGIGILSSPMGATVHDFNNDGLLDLWITDIGGNRLYQGMGNWEFVDVELTWMASGENRPGDVSWSSILVDPDGDGRSEVFVTYGPLEEDAIGSNTDIIPHQPNRLFVNTGAATPNFESFPSLVPERDLTNSRGVARGDFNRDGIPDLVVRHLEGEPSLLLGRCTEASRLVVALSDSRSQNPLGLGARVEVAMSSGGLQSQTMDTSGLGSYSSSSPHLYFGMGQDSVDAIRVFWPDGEMTEVHPTCSHCEITVSR